MSFWRNVELTPHEARRRIVRGEVTKRVRVLGHLNLSHILSLRALPTQLTATTIDLTNCRNLRSLPQGLRCRDLIVRDSGVERLQDGLQVTGRVDAESCRSLRTVGVLELDELNLRDCGNLESLAEGLRVRRLVVSRCGRLSALLQSVIRSVEFLDVSQCPQWTSLPVGFARLQGLNLSGCTGLRWLPWTLRVGGWIELEGTRLESLPDSLQSTRLLWRGVDVPARVILRPQSITLEEILRERNQAVRSVLLTRMGMERFFSLARPTVVDDDRDSGGRRRLLRIDLGDDEPLVCVEVRCPSTGHRYLLRVPPHLVTCHDAIAWTAGYTNPNAYRPLVET